MPFAQTNPSAKSVSGEPSTELQGESEEPNGLLLTDATIATMVGGGYGLLEQSAVLIQEGRIAWVGPTAQAPEVDDSHSCGGRLLTPGLIDCHTHLVYGGDRAHEWEQRLEGASYEDIARAGGGIVATVAATRGASSDDLRALALGRLDDLLAEGVTTVEIKSGYGLDVETELRCLDVARSLGELRPVSVITTYLGAHAVPPEFVQDRAGYLDLITDVALPRIHQRGLADAVDGFCEGIAFSTAEIAQVFDRATELGLPVKLHAEQLSLQGGAALAAHYGALSADHLEYLDPDGVAAMAESGTVAVLLPGAFYYLRETRKPPVDLLRESGVPVAVATDLNPGSSPIHSILTAMNMACVLFELTPQEALLGTTANAARALGLSDRGTIEVGRRADMVLWEVEHPGRLVYPLGANPCRCIWQGGHQVRGATP